jgi:chromosome segregation ATPase
MCRFKEKSKVNLERVSSELSQSLERNRKLLDDLERLRVERDQTLEANLQLKHSSDVANIDKQYLQGERGETKKILQELNETIASKDRERYLLENENQKLKDRIISLEDALKSLESTKIKVNFGWLVGVLHVKLRRASWINCQSR